MVLIIDNYDSFAYNLYQYVGMCHSEVKVLRNDKVTLDEIEKMAPTHIIISPGPGFPKDAGISGDVILRFKGLIPILGVCLGHQTIGEVFGGEVVHAKELMHGKQSTIAINNQCALFKGLPEAIDAARYHSLIVSRETLPECLEVIAEEGTGVIMGLKHKLFPIFGVQFHPESILTSKGITIINNFLGVRA